MADWHCANCMSGNDMSNEFCRHCDNGPRREHALRAENEALRKRVGELEEMALPCEAIDTLPWPKVERIARRILARHYPPDIFDGSSGDPGPVITSALHKALTQIDAARAETGGE